MSITRGLEKMFTGIAVGHGILGFICLAGALDGIRRGNMPEAYSFDILGLVLTSSATVSAWLGGVATHGPEDPTEKVLFTPEEHQATLTAVTSDEPPIADWENTLRTDELSDTIVKV